MAKDSVESDGPKVVIRCFTDERKQRWQSAAEAVGLPFSEFARRVIDEAVDRAIQQDATPKDADAVQALLADPPGWLTARLGKESIARLRRAFDEEKQEQQAGELLGRAFQFLDQVIQHQPAGELPNRPVRKIVLEDDELPQGR